MILIEQTRRARLMSDFIELQEQFSAIAGGNTVVEVTALVIPDGEGQDITYLVDITPMPDYVHDIREVLTTLDEKRVTWQFDNEQQCRDFTNAFCFWSF